MSKELTIYPKLPRRPGPGRGWADLKRDQDRECRLAHEKRFTDAELAAEFHQARAAHQRVGGFDLLSRVYTFAHFATAPHYFEETQP